MSQVAELVARIQKGIPPNEIVSSSGVDIDGVYETTPAQLAAILIAGWIYEIFWQRRSKKSVSYSTLSRLLLKACEDIELTGGGD
jgi:hypothetical protein